MIGPAVHGFHMDISASAACESFKKVGHQLRLQIPHQARADLGIDCEGGASTQINGRDSKSLVHWHQKISGTQNATLVTKGTIETLSQSDPNIFNRVVLVDIEISIARLKMLGSLWESVS